MTERQRSTEMRVPTPRSGQRDHVMIDSIDANRELSTGQNAYAELFRSMPYLPKRIQALRLFADSSFYHRFTGTKSEEPTLSTDELDAKVSEILKVF